MSISLSREQAIEAILATARKQVELCASDHPYDLGLAISQAAEVAGQTLAVLMKEEER